MNLEITPVSIEDELRDSYLDYAMSVIIGKAIPDIRDVKVSQKKADRSTFLTKSADICLLTQRRKWVWQDSSDLYQELHIVRPNNRSPPQQHNTM
tara:strand:+ start:1071 stop:1355 length:285 start_codon:yes stop_codon:yes gene_type:complete